MDPFDITKAAQAYSNITVVLAGFSFAVLMYVVQASGRRHEESSDPAEKGLALIALAFLGNVAIAVLWGMVSGEPSPKGNPNPITRPEILGFVATLLFANNAPLTFQAVALFVAATGRTSLLRLFRWTYLFTVMMAAVFVIVNVLYIHTEIHNVMTHSSELPGYALHSLYGKSLVVLISVFLLLAWLVNLRVGDAAHKAAFQAFTFAWLASSVAFVIFFALISTLSPKVIIPISLIYVLALLWLLITGWAMVFTPGVTRGLEDRRQVIPFRFRRDADDEDQSDLEDPGNAADRGKP